MSVCDFVLLFGQFMFCGFFTLNIVFSKVCSSTLFILSYIFMLFRAAFFSYISMDKNMHILDFTGASTSVGIHLDSKNKVL